MYRPQDPDDRPSKGEADRQEAIDSANRRQWWKNHQSLHLTAVYLDSDETADALDRATTLTNIIDMLEKPWHWTDEFIDAVEMLAAELDRPVTTVLEGLVRGLGPIKRLP